MPDTSLNGARNHGRGGRRVGKCSFRVRPDAARLLRDRIAVINHFDVFSVTTGEISVSRLRNIGELYYFDNQARNIDDGAIERFFGNPLGFIRGGD